MMPSEAEIRMQILEHAHQLFTTHGYSNVTTEHISKDLNISKKTIYKYFQNKESLFREGVLTFRDQMQLRIESIFNSDHNFLNTLHTLVRTIGSTINQFSPLFFEDIQSNFPELWLELESFREKHIKMVFKRLLQKGVNDGFIREELDIDLAVQIYYGMVQSTLNPTYISKNKASHSKLFDVIINIFFFGIMKESSDKLKVFPQ